MAMSAMHIEVVKQPIVTEGKLVCKLPNMIRMETELPVAAGVKMKHLAVCDGKVLWSYIPHARIGYKVERQRVRKELGERIPEECGSDITRSFQDLKRESIHCLETRRLSVRSHSF